MWGTYDQVLTPELFLDWGITFGEPYATPEHAARKVAYANRSGLCLDENRGGGHNDPPRRTHSITFG